MPDLRMPGVYTLEKSTLPPTIGVIPSAVPVFIGYTEKAEKKGEQLENKPTKVKSMKEYEDWFGGPPKVALEVDIDDRIDNPLRPEARVVPPAGFVHKMYHSMLFYYANAGGQCWVVSVGDYDEAPSYDKLQKAIDLLKKVKDVTILVFPDGTSLTESKYAALIAKALTHCEVSKNRVTIIDLHNTNGEDITKIEDGFQTNMPAESDLKKYGMAYYPYVDTIFSHAFDGAGVTVRNHYQTLPADQTTADKIKAELKKLSDPLTEAATKYTDAVKALKALQSEKGITDDLLKKLQDFKALNPAATDAEVKAELDRLVTADEVTIPADIKTELDKPDPKALTILDTASKAYPAKITAAQAAADTAKAPFLTAAKLSAKGVSVADPVSGKNVQYTDLSHVTMGVIDTKDFKDLNLVASKIRDAIANAPVLLPPCGAVAGIYVRTDATRGVWKAPANVSVFGAIKPALEIDDTFHAELNAPPSGKSVNVIRSYPGRGILVYGARTLDGNSLEWRYVNVRRTFCFIEHSVANAMQDFVFEPNNEQTWIKVTSMIRSFLNRLWKAGGLFGSTPEDAYEVLCSVPVTMSVEEMLSGIMRIFIKVAVARPAEFIVLQYEHKFELPQS